MGNVHRLETLIYRKRGDLYLLRVDDIDYICAEHRYLRVHHRKGIAVLSDTLDALVTSRPDLFLRVHRGALINRERLVGLEKKNNRYSVVLEGVDERLVVSRRRVADVRRALVIQARPCLSRPGLCPGS